MSWVKKQAGVTVYANGKNTASVTLTGVTAGSLIPICVGIRINGTNPTACTVSDSNGGVYAAQAVTVNQSVTCGIYYVKNAAAGSHTITVQLGASDNCNITVTVGPEWAGGNTLDVASNTAIKSGTTIVSSGLTTNAANDLVIFTGTQGGGTDSYSAFNDGLSLETTITGGPCSFMADGVVASAGNITPQCTSTSSSQYTAAVAAFLQTTVTTSPTLISHTEMALTANATSLTSASIAVNKGDLVIVKYGDSGWNPITRSCSVSTGSPISFTKIIDIGQYPSYCGNTVWAGFASATGNINVTVSVSTAQSYGCTVEVWRNGAVANYVSGYTTSAKPNVNISLTTNYDNSAVTFESADWKAGAPGTWETGFVATWSDQDTTIGVTLESGNNPDIGASGPYWCGFTSTYQSTNCTMNAIEVRYAPPITEPCSFMGTFAMR